MKNVTIPLPDDVARWLRVKAAENDRSIAGWIVELLTRMRRQEDRYEIAMKRYLAMEAAQDRLAGRSQADTRGAV